MPPDVQQRAETVRAWLLGRRLTDAELRAMADRVYWTEQQFSSAMERALRDELIVYDGHGSWSASRSWMSRNARRSKKSSEEQWREYEASVRGSTALARPAASAAATAADVLAAARKAPPDAWFGDKVFLSAILPYVPASELLRLQRQGDIVLHRADMVSAFDAELVQRSEISPGGYVTYHFVSVPETEQRAMKPNRTPRLQDGYADELAPGTYWQEAGENDWSEVMLTPTDVSGARYLGSVRLEDWQHRVFRLTDGRTVAQLVQMTGNHKGLLRRNASPSQRHRQRGTLPQRQFKLGDYVVDKDGSREGVVSFVGQYDELIGGYRYKVREADGTRKYWNEGNMRLRRNPGSPPPPPERRRRASVDPSLRRVRQLSESHERREKPFDPSIGYERETKPHHFALNPKSSTMEPFREPDVEVALKWAVWYGPAGGPPDGDVATEAEYDGRGFVVREYQHVAGYFDEGTYDESEPFLVLETYISDDDMEKLSFSNDALYNAMNESTNPDEAELTTTPEDDAARLLILRYAAAFGVRHIGEMGGEESFAAELPS